MSRRTKASVSRRVERRLLDHSRCRATTLGRLPVARLGRRAFGLGLCCLGLAVAPNTVSGQTVDAGLRGSIQGLSVGTQLRVLTAGSDPRTGTFLGLDERGLVLDEGTLQALPITPSEVLELSHLRSSWRKGMVVGGLAGALVGTLAGAAFAQLPCDSCTSPKDTGEIAFNVGLTFGILGTALGGAVGLAFHEWHPVYRRAGP